MIRKLKSDKALKSGLGLSGVGVGMGLLGALLSIFCPIISIGIGIGVVGGLIGCAGTATIILKDAFD